MPDLYLPLFALLGVCCVTGLVTMQIFFSRLRRYYEDEWIQLGCPVVFLNSRGTVTGAVIRYLWRRDYAKLDGGGVNRLGNFLRGFIIFYFALFALVLFVLGIPTRR
jgi:hypothetical protein